MSIEKIRILVVDDSVMYRKVIADILSGAPGIEVVGVAANGAIALQKCDQLRPDLLTLDLEMPEHDGLEVLRRLRGARSPIGAIMLSASSTQSAETTIAALQLGAFDFVMKPASAHAADSTDALRRALLPKIEAYARTRLAGAIELPAVPIAAPPVKPATYRRSATRSAPGKVEVVAIGISTGGPQALATVLPHLPAELGVPMLIVQHMPPLFTRSLAEGLQARCALSVREAVDGEPVVAGQILIAPGGKHMMVVRVRDGVRVRITEDPPENSCRPAVDYLFRSIAQVYGSNALGVIMTGMGSDGTLGCRLLKRHGATILAQDESTCVVYGMPKGPAEEGLCDVIAPLDRIAGEVVRLVGTRMASCR